MSARRWSLLAIDQGTTNTKAVLVAADGIDRRGRVSAGRRGLAAARLGRAGRRADLGQRARGGGRRPRAAAPALGRRRDRPVDPTGVGPRLAPRTGVPLGPVIGWQDGRTADWCEGLGDELPRGGHRADRSPHRRHVLRPQDQLAARPPGGRADPRPPVCVGTVDSWLVVSPDRRPPARVEAGQRLPHPAVRHQSTLTGRPRCWTFSGSRRPCFPRCSRLRRRLRHHIGVEVIADGVPDPGRSGRLPRRPLRPGLHRGRHGQGDLRHRHVGHDADRELCTRFVPGAVHLGLAQRRAHLRPRRQHLVLGRHPGLDGAAAPACRSLN